MMKYLALICLVQKVFSNPLPLSNFNSSLSFDQTLCERVLDPLTDGKKYSKLKLSFDGFHLPSFNTSIENCFKNQHFLTNNFYLDGSSV